mgnify:CR=1 FL=1
MSALPAARAAISLHNLTVSYRQPPDYAPEPGTCLLCVCTPKTAVTLEA